MYFVCYCISAPFGINMNIVCCWNKFFSEFEMPYKMSIHFYLAAKETSVPSSDRMLRM
jgi:hypothetical protein